MKIDNHKKKLNVLICAYGLDGQDVGESQQTYQWVSNLSLYANVWLITAGSRINEKCGLENVDGVELIKLVPKISFKRFDRFDRAAHPGYIEYFFRARKEIKKIINEQKIDVCHHLSPFSFRYPSPLIFSGMPFIAGPIYGGLKAPAVMEEFSAKEGVVAKLRFIDDLRMRFDPMLRMHYNKAAKLIISAPYVEDGLLSRDKGKTEVISGIAIDKSLIRTEVKRLPNKDIKLICVSRLVASKGIELLILALSQCKNKQKITLDIYGTGHQENEYIKLSNRIGLEGIVNWKGFTPNSQVIKAYLKADAFILPSLKEPAGIAVIEAMALGLPVLCVDAGGPSYSVDSNCGIKIKLTNKEQMVNDLAEAIDFIVENPERRLEMGRHGQLRIKSHFTWDAVINKTLELYSTTLE